MKGRMHKTIRALVDMQDNVSRNDIDLHVHRYEDGQVYLNIYYRMIHETAKR